MHGLHLGLEFRYLLLQREHLRLELFYDIEQILGRGAVVVFRKGYVEEEGTDEDCCGDSFEHGVIVTLYIMNRDNGFAI